MKVLVTQLCPTLHDSMDCNLPGPSVYEILQARILEWVVIPFSRGSSQPRDRTQVSALQASSLHLIHQGSPKLPFNPAIQLLGIDPEKTMVQKVTRPECSLQCYLQYARHGSNLNVHHRWMDKDVVCIYNGILLSHYKEWNNAICSNMDGPGDDHTKWNKSDKETQISYDISYMWNLKKWYKWTYLQNRNTNLDNRLKVMKGRGIDWKFGIDTWLYLKWITYNGILLRHKKEYIWVSSNEVDKARAYYTEWSKSEREI